MAPLDNVVCGHYREGLLASDRHMEERAEATTGNVQPRNSHPVGTSEYQVGSEVTTGPLVASAAKNQENDQQSGPTEPVTSHPSPPVPTHRKIDTPCTDAERTNKSPDALDPTPRKKGQFTRRPRDYTNLDQQDIQYHRLPPVHSMDPVEKVKGMYRLLDLIGESGSNGYVDKVIIAQDSLQRFINAVSPGAYASITKVDFKTLDQLMIKPLGIYGSKDEIVRLLQSIGAVEEDAARFLQAPSDSDGSRSTLSSGLYIVRANTTNLADERHYVIYWPEETTWNDSATSSVLRNRVTFMRCISHKDMRPNCCSVIPEHSASLVWKDEDADTENADVEIGDSDRLFTFEVAETNEQEENAVARPGFQMNSRLISPYESPSDCPVDPSVLAPRLLSGETTQGFLTASFIPRQTRSEAFDELSFSRVSLKQLLIDNALVLSESLDENAVQTLVNIAIADLFPEDCDKWRATNEGIRARYMQELAKRKDKVREEIVRGEGSLRRVLRDVLVEDVMKLFPPVAVGDGSNASQEAAGKEILWGFLWLTWLRDPLQISDLESLYPGFRNIYQRCFQNARFDTILRLDSRFESQKLRLTTLRYLFERNQRLVSEGRAELIKTVLFKGNFRRAQQIILKMDNKKRSGTDTWSLFSSSGGSEDSLEREMRTLAAKVPDSQFLVTMKGVEDDDMRPAIAEFEALAHEQLASSIDATVKSMARAVLTMQQEHCERSIQHEMESEERKSRSNALVKFIQDINAQSVGRRDSVVYLDFITAAYSAGRRDPRVLRSPKDIKLISPRVMNHDRINAQRGDPSSSYHGSSSPYGQEYVITGRRESPQEPKLEFWVHLTDLASDDRHNMQLDPQYTPNPAVNERLSFTQILENEKLLLVLYDQDRVSIYLERLTAMNMAIQRDRSVKSLSREKLGEDILFAFDEMKRALVLQLHMFVFDETFRTLQTHGSSINLAPWYNRTGVSILHTAFVGGDEEVVLVDSRAQARIFSFVTLQFRPASLQLPSLPNAIFSSPDGSCLLALIHNPEPSLTVYHWETFGSTGGIPLDVPKFPLQGAILTSMVNRGRVFLVGIDIASRSIQSIAIDITKKLKEFMFKEHGSRNTAENKKRHPQHNCLLDCHAEVWSRFPVVPAVKRRAITSLSERQQKSITFIADHRSQRFDSYFSDLIQTFESTIKKPTGDELRRIKVSATPFGSFQNTVVLDPNWDISRYRVGEWLVDLLCLIPIHIAVCRENRFIPLADGVLSADLERSLLGAPVNKIVDKLSFGWYESIFQSYLATKPVKVVSSMGQQSVGKSFSLNHLLDTSFAGSAMRTTEGVWMSVTPTDEALIVALDFEGWLNYSHSCYDQSTEQIVLFRNNFAFSRDISGLFQSFQSRCCGGDKVEITREFSLKFQKIVQQEQSTNFISRLHRGKLDIIPWPVIESKEFYKLFSTLKKRLDVQNTSHPTAGEFLLTIKTMMAKLRACFFNLTLAALLPIALSTGYSEVEPDFEPLKNLDTDLIVEGDDGEAYFAIFEGKQVSPAEIEMRLAALRDSWSTSVPRQSMPDSDWTTNLASHISGLVDLRVNHVRLWLDSNLERFQGGHAAIEDLRRRFDNMVIEMRTNAQFCRAQSAKPPTSSSLVVHLTLAPDILGSICCLEGEVAYMTARKSADSTALLGHEFTYLQVAGHVDDEHMCSALVHMCGEVSGLKHWFFRETHPCSAWCSASGICRIDTTPLSIEATFTGRHESFQYTKYSQVAKRLPCVKTIKSGRTSHSGPHIHTNENQPFHFCETRCKNCGYFCTLPLGHTQKDHETSHGSMTQTRWAIDGPDEAGIELGGRKFSSDDEGAPMLCNLTCSYRLLPARSKNARCDGVEVQHINTRMTPNLDKPKDAITHRLYWSRMGQLWKMRCYVLGARTLDRFGETVLLHAPMFHLPRKPGGPVDGHGYISNDGHLFECKNPVVMQRAFHVIFVIDRSISMGSTDRKPLEYGPAVDLIRLCADNRLGAVYSALYSFWSARHAAITASQQAASAQQGTGARRDAYSVVLFNHSTKTAFVNDFTSSPEELLYSLLHEKADGATNFSLALAAGQSVMMQVTDEAIQDLCYSAIQYGKPLSFHAVSFGKDNLAATLRRMAELALEVQNEAPHDPLLPTAANIPSSFATALDSVRLTETFLGIAESLRKLRGSLMH
ncbi:hypothetical protein BJV78DRAFT_1153084 [Lactifluus subvellereus]|nr:hypothetical protein BJV78DRAFT_1153084 [Lactifluus subvellereus]